MKHNCKEHVAIARCPGIKWNWEYRFILLQYWHQHCNSNLNYTFYIAWNSFLNPSIMLIPVCCLVVCFSCVIHLSTSWSITLTANAGNTQPAVTCAQNSLHGSTLAACPSDVCGHRLEDVCPTVLCGAEANDMLDMWALKIYFTCTPVRDGCKRQEVNIRW
jgi:hypothetical protein